MRDLLEFRLLGKVENVVTAIVQIVAGSSDRADRGVAGDRAGEGNGFFRFG